MGQKKTLNKKRLTKRQIQEVIETEGRLHKKYQDILRKLTHPRTYAKKPLMSYVDYP